MSRTTSARAVVPALLLVMAAVTASAQEPRLGSIEFPTSGAPAAQPHFLRGVLYLHSFEYGSAATAFREAQRLDPGFAMAYWGEAMTYTHPVWNEQNVAAARAALGRLAPTPEARAAKAGTERERAYLAAVEALYGEGSKARRDTVYALAMERLASEQPDDLEARAFHALAILALNQGVRDQQAYERAGAIALGVLEKNPDHPGGAHYVIHAFDDPLHAKQGLEAARAYSKIAPDAAHAQHMTTHIFLALGMWDEVVSQNEIASHHTDWRSGHYVSWYAYGLLQLGRRREAAVVLERARKNWPANLGPALRFMRAHQVILTERWDDPSLDWDIPDPVGTTPRAIEHFVRGYAAVQRGDRQQAQARRSRLATLAEEATRKGDTPTERALPGILGSELEAAILHAESRSHDALTLLQQAAEREASLPVEFGPPYIVKPTFELLGEVLLALDRPAEAVRAFTRALELAPRRAPSLLGLARSADKAGDAALAVQTWETLAEVWRNADPEVPALTEVRRRVAAR